MPQFERQRRLLQMIERLQGVTVKDAPRDLHCTMRTSVGAASMSPVTHNLWR